MSPHGDIRIAEESIACCRCATAYFKNTVITSKIKAKPAEEKLASAMHIQVDTDNKGLGLVTLSGTARTQEEADKAVSIARNVEGVAAVENKIDVVTRK